MNAVITGATKGIGLAISRELAQKGYNLCVCSRSNEDLNTMKSQFEEEYSEIDLYIKSADLSKKQEVLEFGQFCIENLGQIDVLINNAGVFIPGAIAEEEEGALELMINTNLYSAYHLTRKLLGGMRNLKKGYIINICSIASKIAYPNGGSYSISKFALLGFSKVLREELKDTGIKVSAILPGATWSNSWKGVELPEERLMQATDIAKTIGSILELGDSAVIEEIVMRPQLGDL